jgi:hypothetical protein
MASDKMEVIYEYIDTTVNIVGTTMIIKAYITGDRLIYNLLLSCSWIESIGAAEYYRMWEFIVAGMERQCIVVQPTAVHLLYRI